VALASPAPPLAADDLRQPDLRLLAERHIEGQSGTFVVYGDGIGIWNHRLPFQVSPPVLDRLVAAVELAGFRAMPPAFGQGKKWLTRRVAVKAGAFAKEVVQLRGGEQSNELRALTNALFDAVAPLTGAGTTASDLADGLRKVASGELAPETLLVIAHVKPRADQAAKGFLVRVEDGRATRQEFRAGAYAPPRDVSLSPEALREMAGLLAESGLAALPANLHAEVYTELVVQVLDQRKSVLARGFSGAAAEAERENRDRFERLFTRLASLLDTAGRK
jgi:hypothetical protein